MSLFSADAKGKAPTDFSALMNAGLVTAREKQVPRSYLGASRWGEECERRLGYEYFKAPQMPERKFQGETYRIFDMGHDGEARMAEYMRYAGFALHTEKEDGSQWGFAVAPHPETGVARLSGHIDGGISAGPELSLPCWVSGAAADAPVVYPCLWETKALGNRSFNDVLKKGIKKSKPVYYAQVQVYCSYLRLENGCLFTCINRDTGEVYGEWIPFDPVAAQEASDKGVKIISVSDPRELPRMTNDPEHFKCKFCPFAETCWSSPQVAGNVEAPGWLFGR